MKKFFRSFRVFLVISWLGSFFFINPVSAQDNYSMLRGSPEDSLLTRNFPGAWNLPNTKLYMKFGGYFRLDAIYDFTGSGSRYQLLMNQIPASDVPASAVGPFFNMHVRETRFNFDIRRTTDMGRTLKIFLEFDFFDESLKAGQPRLRHAFIKYGNWLFGQTWTNLSDLRVFPFIMDFSAGDALFGGRSIQVRYENNFTKHWQYGLALEMPSLDDIYNPDSISGLAMPVMPLFSARITNSRDNGMISLGGQVEQLRWDGLKQSPNATGVGWGVVLNGRQSITSRLFATWHASYNSGMTSQILIFAGTDQGAVITADGKIHNEDAITLAVGAGYQITKAFSTNLAFAHMNRGELKFRDDHTLDNGYMGHFNIIWKIDKHAMTGIEYAWSEIENLNKARGSASRIQIMAKYDF